MKPGDKVRWRFPMDKYKQDHMDGVFERMAGSVNAPNTMGFVMFKGNTQPTLVLLSQLEKL